MLERSSLGNRLRKSINAWLDQNTHLRSDFLECAGNAFVAADVHISDPSTVKLGEGSAIYRGCTLLTGPGSFVLSDGAHLAGSVYINALQSSIFIGVGTAIGPFSTLLSYSNAVLPGKTIAESRTSGQVHIGDDVFIGAGVVVLPGITIGDHAVIGAGSVVNRDVPKWAMVAGVPAKIIGRRV